MQCLFLLEPVENVLIVPLHPLHVVLGRLHRLLHVARARAQLRSVRGLEVFYLGRSAHFEEMKNTLIINCQYTFKYQTSFPYFGVKLSCVCLMFDYKKKL